jgi:DNA-binding XRE family transcriptional regulator
MKNRFSSKNKRYSIFAYLVIAYKVSAFERQARMAQTLSPHDRQNRLLAATLKQLRLNLSLTQSELAQRAGLRQSDVSKVENGIRQVGYLELRVWLAALDCSIGIFDAAFSTQLRNGSVQPFPLPEPSDIVPVDAIKST